MIKTKQIQIYACSFETFLFERYISLGSISAAPSGPAFLPEKRRLDA